MLRASIFKANDIRGIVGAEWDSAGAWALGRAYAELVTATSIVVGRDMRLTSPAIADAFIAGVTSGGVGVTDIGLASTDQLWYASGVQGLPGVQITASHNPAHYNGMKLCRPGAQPVTPEFLVALAERARAIDAGPPVVAAGPAGAVEHQDVLAGYAAFLRAQVDLAGLRPLRVVVDAGNGMAGHTGPAVLAGLDIEVIGLFMEPDGRFPNHPPDPLVPENLVDARAAVRSAGADLGLVFDGDADRVFVIDETGEVVPPSAITAMIAVNELAAEPGAVIVVNTITSAAVSEIVEERGGVAVTAKVGHTYMKAMMAEHGAVFGGERSAHYYFRDFFGADTGWLAALHVIAAAGRSDPGVAELVRRYSRYTGSGEINSEVVDPAATMARLTGRLGHRGSVDTTDGVLIRGDGWWVSLRASNTEPVLRLNVEARTASEMARLRDDVLEILKEE